MKQIKITPCVTVRSDTVDAYLRDLNQLELVSTEEEVELAIRIHSGDEQAYRRLVEANLRFVVSVAKQYQNKGLDLADLIAEGNLGLMKAALKFDPSRGFKFISYAVWWIRQQIMQALSEKVRIVRLPLNKIAVLNKMNKARGEFLQENEREPSDAELAALMDISPDKLECTDITMLSLDYPIGEDQDNTLADIIPDRSIPATDSQMDVESLRNDIHNLMTVLNMRERRVLELNFGIGCQAMSLDEIGAEMDLTRERVRQLKMKALHKLSHPAVRSKLVQYL
ncbi:MAG: sigma-70 family RNA polymerase sigma factor [Bacteroidales bacterium]|nr:sigma-70 family RNA polymerase sigma factor [Bacteroidales bacterium]